MKFNDVVSGICKKTDLRRIASAHVVDYQNLSEDELRKALLKVKPQYLHNETIRNTLDTSFYLEPDELKRKLSRIILVDVLMNQDGFHRVQKETNEKATEFQQYILDRSNELDIIDFTDGKKDGHHYRELELYNFVLQTAWEDNVQSPDEVNLLRKLRRKLKINEYEHRILEAKLGKYPKNDNDMFMIGEIETARRYLQSVGVLFTYRDGDDIDYDVIPEEIATEIRSILSIEMKEHNYRLLLDYKRVRKKDYLMKTLDDAGIEYRKDDTITQLQEKVIRNVPPSIVLGGSTPQGGLFDDDIYKWCSDLGIMVSGTKQDKINRLIDHYDSILRGSVEGPDDDREKWYANYDKFASRDHEFLRAQHMIDKDLEIEHKFEEATSYLFEKKLNHTPLKQPGSKRPDGMLSFKDMYVMWDNKSKESPVNLKDHLKQFDDYMEASDKRVPIFLVIGPDFTAESLTESMQYTAQHIDRKIVLVKAGDLRELAEEWNSESNRKRDEPFPLGYLMQSGKFDRSLLGKKL